MELRKVAVKKWIPGEIIEPKSNMWDTVGVKYKIGTNCFSDEIEYYGFFHRWFDGRNDIYAMIEKEDGLTVVVRHEGLIFLNEVKVIGE